MRWVLAVDDTTRDVNDGSRQPPSAVARAKAEQKMEGSSSGLRAQQEVRECLLAERAMRPSGAVTQEERSQL